MAEKLTVTGELVNLRESALTTVRHAENLMEQFGLLKSRTVGGGLHTDRLVESIQREKEDDDDPT